MPGLLRGFLIRHLDGAGSLLNPYLAEVEVWHLETTRATGEYRFRVRDRDADALAGHERRRFTPHEVVGYLVVNARFRGDEKRLEELEQVGERLVDSARAAVANYTEANGKDGSGASETGGDGAGGEGAGAGVPGEDLPDEVAEFLAVAQSWAAEFRIDDYEVTQTDNEVVIQFERPVEIAEALAPSTSRLETTQTLYGLSNRYAQKNETPDQWPTDTLNEDIATAEIHPRSWTARVVHVAGEPAGRRRRRRYPRPRDRRCRA